MGSHGILLWAGHLGLIFILLHTLFITFMCIMTFQNLFECKNCEKMHTKKVHSWEQQRSSFQKILPVCELCKIFNIKTKSPLIGWGTRCSFLAAIQINHVRNGFIRTFGKRRLNHHREANLKNGAGEHVSFDCLIVVLTGICNTKGIVILKQDTHFGFRLSWF